MLGLVLGLGPRLAHSLAPTQCSGRMGIREALATEKLGGDLEINKWGKNRLSKLGGLQGWSATKDHYSKSDISVLFAV